MTVSGCAINLVVLRGSSSEKDLLKLILKINDRQSKPTKVFRIYNILIDIVSLVSVVVS